MDYPNLIFFPLVLNVTSNFVYVVNREMAGPSKMRMTSALQQKNEQINCHRQIDKINVR